MLYKIRKYILVLVVISLSGASLAEDLSAEKLSPMEVKGATTISHKEAKELFDSGVKFVDIRKDSDWEAGRIPDAIHLELKKVFNKESLAEKVLPSEKVVFYCNGPKCLRSSKASAMAVEWGYSKVYYYRDGFPDWDENGYPAE